MKRNDMTDEQRLQQLIQRLTDAWNASPPPERLPLETNLSRHIDFVLKHHPAGNPR
jgi:hypothetical protein